MTMISIRGVFRHDELRPCMLSICYPTEVVFLSQMFFFEREKGFLSRFLAKKGFMHDKNHRQN